MLATTYASALRACFLEDDTEAFFSCIKEFKELNSIFSPLEIKKFFLSPAVPVEQKIESLKKVFNFSKVSEITAAFYFLLLEKKRWTEKTAIAGCLEKMEEEMRGIVSVKVESAQPLSKDLKEDLTRKLKAFFNREIFLKEKEASSELVGGVKIQAKGVLFDDSLLFHLKQMESQIRRNFHDHTG